jgi:hypothetical protein
VGHSLILLLHIAFLFSAPRERKEILENNALGSDPSSDDCGITNEFIDKMLLHSVTVKLEAFDWPICLCHGQCSCDIPTVPTWILNFAKVSPSQNCLDIQELDLQSPFFLDGVKLAFAYMERKKADDPFALLLEFLFSPLDALTSQDDLLQRKELVLEDIAKCKGRDLYAKASGFYCGYTIYEQQTRWTHYRKQEAKNGKMLILAVESLMSLFEELLEPLNVLRVWLEDPSRCQNMPRMKKVLIAALFWNSQWLLYMIYEVKRNVFFGYGPLSDEYQRGLLLWQQGWMASHPDVVRAFLKVLSFD